jgi:hypothetical protein
MIGTFPTFADQEVPTSSRTMPIVQDVLYYSVVEID